MATYNFNTSTVETRASQRSILSKSFLYMFLFLMVTVVVSVVFAATFQYGIVDETLRARVYTGLMIGAAITQIVLTVIIAFTSLKQGKAAMIPMALYAICMGILISSFSLFLSWWTLAATFGIAALAFGGMALIGVFSKNASGLGMVGFGLLFGVLMVSLFNIFMVLFLPGAWATVNIVTSVIIVIAIMLITAYDVYNIRQISARCQDGGNIALYLAFNLYLDFIIILIHLLRLVAIFASDRN